MVRVFQWCTWLATAITWPLIAFGAIVRLRGAGLACPDWPRCFGQWIPPNEYGVVLEVGHRAVAVLVGFLITILFVSSFFSSLKRYRKIASLIFFLVIFQGILGGLTVLLRLKPITIIGHLIMGNLLFLVLVYLSYWVFQDTRTKHSLNLISLKRLTSGLLAKWTLIILILFFGIMASGGVNSSTSSGYVCSAFPGCQGGTWGEIRVNPETSEITFQQNREGFWPVHWTGWVHMFHRILAIVGGTIIVVFCVRVMRTQSRKVYHWLGGTIIIAICAEILIGMTNALYHIPFLISMSHTAVAATIVGLLGLQLAIAGYHEQ